MMAVIQEKSDVDLNPEILSDPDTTKGRIERAALEMFVQRGVDGVSVREIGARAGITDAAIYRHFVSKAALAESLMLGIHNHLAALVRAVAKSEQPFRAQITDLVSGYCALADAQWQLFAYHLLHLNHFPELFAPVRGPRKAKDSPASAAVDMIRGAMERGEIPPGNAELLAAMALGVVLQAANSKTHNRLSGPLSVYQQEFDKAVWAIVAQK